MKLLMIQPPHSFVKTDLPPMPGVQGRHDIVRCECCGIMGYTPDDTHVILFNTPRKEHLARNCNGHQNDGVLCWHARITSPHLTVKGPAFAHLTLGSVHRLLPPPDSDPLTLPGIWVRGPQEPVKLLPGEYLPVQLRTRRRVRSVTIEPDAHAPKEAYGVL